MLLKKMQIVDLLSAWDKEVQRRLESDQSILELDKVYGDRTAIFSRQASATDRRI